MQWIPYLVALAGLINVSSVAASRAHSGAALLLYFWLPLAALWSLAASAWVWSDLARGFMFLGQRPGAALALLCLLGIAAAGTAASLWRWVALGLLRGKRGIAASGGRPTT
jgi:hypothetical protein